MEHPSRELVQQLGALGLASAADLRRCAGRVRRLARGLPATESVWMDALVLSGKLSLFQARTLEAGRSEELVIGRKFVLHSPLHLDPLLSAYSARMPGRHERVRISRIVCPEGEGEAAALRLLKTIKSLSVLPGQFPFLPFDALLERGQIFLLAPFSPGESLLRLLVRRGRFPEAVVRVIAQEALRPLQAAELLAVHGDLRPANLWLTSRGEIHLLNWGLLDAVTPEVNIHSRLPLDAHDGMAPERIDSSQRAAPVSDIYGLGCLLWQLLTGRPPHAVADPLAKITAHRLKQIPDVRTLAPDVSESLALLIRNMTAREPHRRPQSYQEVRQHLGTSSSWNRGRLQRFYRQFETAAPRQSAEPSAKSKIPALAGAVLLTAGLCVAAWNRDQLGWPALNRVSAATSDTGIPRETSKRLIAQTLPAEAAAVDHHSRAEQMAAISSAASGQPPAFPLEANESVQQAAAALQPPLQELPSPTLEGVFNLNGTQPYAAGTMVTGETLVLRGTAAAPAVIRIQDLPLVLESEQVRLEYVHLVIDSASSSLPIQSPVQLRAQTLFVHQCLVRDQRTETRIPLIQWLASSSQNQAGARLLIHESLIQTSGAVLGLEIPLSAARFDQVLVRGAATLLDLRQGTTSGVRAPVILKSCTIRECGAVASLPGEEILQRSGQISLQGEQTVIALKRGSPLVAFPEMIDAARLALHLEVDAQGLIVEVGTMLAGVSRGTLGSGYEEIASDSLRVDGLLSGDFHFEATAKDEQNEGTEKGADLVVIDALPVRLSSQNPGVHPQRLPSEILREPQSGPR